jgi:hypothetical protein
MHALAALLAASALGLALASPLAGDPPARDRAAGDRPSGTLVFLSRGNRLTSVDVASGHRTARRVPGVATCGPEMEVTGGHVVFAGFRKHGTVVFSVPAGLEQRPRELGAAHQFVRSATEGRVWLVGTDCHRSHMTGVKEVTVTGRVVVRSSRRVPSTWVAGATERGLVLLRRRELFVWDPVTGREFRWPNPRSSFNRSARSFPDGVLLAKPKLGKRTAGKRRWHVELVDSRTGKSTPVPGSTTGELYPDPRWSPSSGWLFFRAGRGSLKAYRPGADRAITIGVGWPARAVSYVVG